MSVSIDDLKPATQEVLKPVDPTTIMPQKVEKNPGEPDPVEKAYDDLDRVAKEMEERAVKAIIENNERIKAEQALSEGNTTQQQEIINPDDLSDEIVTEPTNDMSREEIDNIRLNKLKCLIKDKIKPITDEIDLASFTISKKPEKLFNLFGMQEKQAFVADWLLPASNRIISMEEFKGTEIDSLNPQNSSRTPLNTTRDILYTIWSHIKNTNKPPFENWIKVTKFADLEHLYFAVYKASFDGVNSVPYFCSNDKCDEVFIKDVDIMDMVKFKDEADKEAFSKSLVESRDSHYDDSDLSIELECVQISNDLVVSIKEPTLFSVQIEPLYLSQKYREENAEFINILAYIEDIYAIDRASKQLVPLQYKEYEDSVAKTIASRYQSYIEAIKSLHSDQLYTLRALIAALDEKNMEIEYVIPEQVCPKCKSKIPEEVRRASDILFTRHQLAALANM